MSPLTNILAHLDDGQSCRRRLELCSRLAQDYDAHLTALYIGRFLTENVLVDAPPSGKLIEALEEEQQRRTAAAHKMFESVTGNLGSRREFRQEDGDAVHWLSLHGRYADLIVVNQPDEIDIAITAGGIPGALALSSGRPVLVIPRTGADDLSPARIMVAWNGSRESARAVADALPFLQRAEEVEVVTISEQGGTADRGQNLRNLCRRLGLHGVKAEAVDLPPSEIGVSETLLSCAAAQGADLIVLGAYGRSRFRELVLGGVTRHFLAHSAVPLLLSH